MHRLSIDRKPKRKFNCLKLLRAHRLASISRSGTKRERVETCCYLLKSLRGIAVATDAYDLLPHRSETNCAFHAAHQWQQQQQSAKLFNDKQRVNFKDQQVVYSNFLSVSCL